MSDLVKNVLAAGGAVLYTIMPAKGVSANEVAKEFSKGQTPVVVVQDKEGIGRTVGRGKFSIGVEGGYESIDTEVTKGEATQQQPAGIPPAAFPPTGPISIDPSATNGTYDFTTKRRSAFLVGSYGLTDWLEVSGKIGGTQSDFSADSKIGGISNFNSESDGDLAYGARITAVPVQFEDGLYLALTGSWTQGNHNDMGINVNPTAKVDVDWKEIVASLEIGKRIGDITPYVGLINSRYREERTLNDIDLRSKFNFEREHPWEGYAGVQAKLKKKLDLGAQVNYGGDKPSFFINLRLRH